jgi:hypothetical protein
MGCVHTQWKIHVIEGWGSPSHIQNVMEKIREASRKLGKIGQTINQALALGPEHDRIWAQWASNIPLESILKRV